MTNDTIEAPQELHAITLKQPWAWAITDLDKRIENRTRQPWAKLCGTRIAIHAGSEYVHAAAQHLHDRGLALPDFFGAPTCAAIDRGLKVAPRGAIVATAFLVGALRGAVPAGQQQWAEGPECWALGDVLRLVHPIPCRGRQGFWKVPEGEAARVLRSAVTRRPVAGAFDR